jgi:hypothetical protein
MPDKKKNFPLNSDQFFPYSNVNETRLVFPPATHPWSTAKAVDILLLNNAIQAINEMAKKPTVSKEEIEKIKDKTGISMYNISQRFTLFKQANLWGQAAYELNGMSFAAILEELSSLSVNDIQELSAGGKAYVGVGENSQVVQITTFILELERGQIARDIGIDWAVSNISLKNRTIIEWNRQKFTRNQLIILPDRAQRENLFFGKQPAYNGFPLPPPGKEQPDYPTGKEELARVVWEDFQSEGSSASINIWDSAIFTWGRGFAGKGGALMVILSKLYRDPQIGELFRNIGIHVTANETLVILDPIENKLITGGTNNTAVWNYIKNNHSLLLFFISLSEMKYMPFINDNSRKQQVRQKVINEQFNFIIKYNPMFNMPQSQLDKWQVELGSEYKNFIAFIAHLFHWQPLYGMDLGSNILKNPNGSYISGSIKELLLRFAEKASIPSDTYWFSVSNTDIPVFISNLNKAKGGIARFILDEGHFLHWGHEIAKRKIFGDPRPDPKDPTKPKIPIPEGGAIPFADSSEINPQHPAVKFRLNTPQFQGAGVYFKPDMKSGYIIKR